MSILLERLDDLILACTEGSLEKVQRLIEDHDVNKIQRLPGSCYQTPLLEACRFNNPHLLQPLLSKGATPDLHLPDEQENTSTECSPLVMSIVKFTCSPDTCFKVRASVLLHSYGANLSKMYTSVGTLMHLVVKSGCHHVVEWLIEQGCDLNTVYRNQTALQIAVSSKNIQIVKRLIQANACPNDQLKVMGLAVIRGYEDVVRMLLAAGVMYKLHVESTSIKVLFSTNWLVMGNESISNLLEAAKSEVPTLQHICRLVTRQNLGTCSRKRVDSLLIPTVHKEYIRLKELDEVT